MARSTEQTFPSTLEFSERPVGTSCSRFCVLSALRCSRNWGGGEEGRRRGGEEERRGGGEEERRRGEEEKRMRGGEEERMRG